MRKKIKNAVEKSFCKYTRSTKIEQTSSGGSIDRKKLVHPIFFFAEDVCKIENDRQLYQFGRLKRISEYIDPPFCAEGRSPHPGHKGKGRQEKGKDQKHRNSLADRRKRHPGKEK